MEILLIIWIIYLYSTTEERAKKKVQRRRAERNKIYGYRAVGNHRRRPKKSEKKPFQWSKNT